MSPRPDGAERPYDALPPDSHDPRTEHPLAEGPLAENSLAENPLTQTPLAENPLTQTPLTQNSLAHNPLAPVPPAPPGPLPGPDSRRAPLDRRAAAAAIDGDGTGEEVWRGDERLCGAPLQWLPAGPVVVVAAHPDDEVLGFGGSMAMLAGAGQAVHSVCLTDGEGSHPGEPIGPRRQDELAAALRALGPVAERFRGGLPDTGLDAHEDQAADLLTEVLLACGPRLCVAPWDGDLHSDHEAAGRAAALACRRTGTRLWSYPVWMWHWAGPGDARVRWDALRLVPLTREAQARKRAAVSCFTSQLRARDAAAGLGPVLPPEEIAHHTRAFETVI